jgi:hypothetical protein
LESLLAAPSTSSSLAYFTPTSSLCKNNVDVGAVEVGGILPLPSLSPKKLSPGKSPSKSHQSYRWTVQLLVVEMKLPDCH